MFNNNLTHHPPQKKKIVGVKWFYFLNDFSISLKTCKPWFAVMLIPGIHNEHTLSYSLSKLKTFYDLSIKKLITRQYPPPVVNKIVNSTNKIIWVGSMCFSSLKIKNKSKCIYSIVVKFFLMFFTIKGVLFVVWNGMYVKF